MDPVIVDGARRQSQLEAAKVAFFASGKMVELVSTGKGEGSGITGGTMASHMNKLRVERDLLAPRVKVLAGYGLNPTEIGKKMNISVSRVRLISREHSIPLGKKCASDKHKSPPAQTTDMAGNTGQRDRGEAWRWMERLVQQKRR
jgi:hypothetical protein